MKKLENQSDREINTLVARALRVPVYGDYGNHGISVMEFKPSKRWRVIDYCNNPNDSKDIITEYGISINFNGNKCTVNLGDIQVESSSTRCWRAAMICFLKFKQNSL